MAATNTHTAKGYIIAVQEERFRMVTEDGQGLLLGLSNNPTISLEELQDWQQNQSLVSVEYRGEPNLASALVIRIKLES